MPAGRSLVTEGPRPEDLVDLINVRVLNRRWNTSVPYFEVETDDGPLRIRVHYRSTATMEWVDSHKNEALDLTIFPYAWEACGRSGVINYYQRARVHQTQDQGE